MLGGTGSEPHSDEDRSACRGASQGDVTARVGPSAQCEGTCLQRERSPSRGAGKPPPRAGASGGLGGCVVSGEAGSSAADRAAAVGLEGAGARARLDVPPSFTLRAAACHAACQAPWHPEDGRCAVPRSGPEDWARWRLWGRASTSAGRSKGTQRSLRLAQSHTIVCANCGDLVPLQKARTAARGAGRDGISPADGCYGCGRHYRKSRRAERQGAMALAVLAGTRVLLETPPSAAARVELWMLPRSEAEGHARRVLGRYQPRGLGRWLTHACYRGA